MTTYSKALMMGVASMALLAGSAWAQGSPRVGVVSAVNPAAVGTPPGADARPIVIGSDVIFREKVVTTGDGQAQLMFLDQSTMMIGPNSQVVIDEFVFDPNTSSGKFAATLTQGSFRYIGGKLSKQGNATLKTPVATIGIRGSDVIVNHNGTTNASGVQNIHGNATVESNGQTVKLPTGFATQVNGPGQSPNYPSALTAAIITAAKLAFEGQPGKNAGATQVPQNADVENSGLPAAVQAAQLQAINPAAGGGSLPPPPTVANNPAVNQGNNTVATGTQTGATGPNGQTISGNEGGTRTAGTQSSTNGGGTGGVIVTPGNGGNNGNGNGNNPPGNNNGGTAIAATMVGYVGGAGFSYFGDDSIVDPYMITNDNPSDVAITTSPGATQGATGTVAASLTFRSVDNTIIQSGNVLLGDVLGLTGNSVLLPDGTFVAVSPTNTGETIVISENGATAPRNATINGAPATSSSVIVSYYQATGNLSQFVQNVQNVNVCTCEFMSWGFWVGTVQQAYPNTRVDTILGTFAAGVLPNIAIEPTTSATFSGHVIGVSTRSGGYTAGNFTNAYNFGTRSGTVNITNFDSNNMTGTVNAGTDWRHYSGSLTPTTAGPANAGAVKGSFYVAPNTAAGTVPQGTAGNVVLTGPNGYAASGTFVAKR